MLAEGEVIEEAEYQGRKVTLNKPMRGDVKKSKVYVKNAKGNVVKVNFGDPNMKIRKSNPKARKSFRARHNCENPGPKWKARYWSCNLDLTKSAINDIYQEGSDEYNIINAIRSYYGALVNYLLTNLTNLF